MGGRAEVREELRKLKSIAEHSEEWASKVMSSLVVTHDLCKTAAGVLYQREEDALEVEKVMAVGAEAVADSVAHVVELAREKSFEVVTYVHNRAQGLDGSQNELRCRVEQATLAVALAIFETLQMQAEEFAKLAEKSMGVGGKGAGASSPRLSKKSLTQDGVSNSISSMEMPKDKMCYEDRESDATGTDDVDLDWKSFERDLQAMTDVVETGLSCTEETIRVKEMAELTTAQVKGLKIRNDDLEVDNSSTLCRGQQAENRFEEALRRAEDAESALGDAVRRAEKAEAALRGVQRNDESPATTESPGADASRVPPVCEPDEGPALKPDGGMRTGEGCGKKDAIDERMSQPIVMMEMVDMREGADRRGGDQRPAASASVSGGSSQVGQFDGEETERRESGHGDGEARLRSTDSNSGKSAGKQKCGWRVGALLPKAKSFYVRRRENGDGEVNGSGEGTCSRRANPSKAGSEGSVSKTESPECGPGRKGGSRPPLQRTAKSDLGARRLEEDWTNPFLSEKSGVSGRDDDYINPFGVVESKRSANNCDGQRRDAVGAGKRSREIRSKNPFMGTVREEDPGEDSNPFLASERPGESRLIADDQKSVPGPDVSDCARESTRVRAPASKKSGDAAVIRWNPFAKDSITPGAVSGKPGWNPFEAGEEAARDKRKLNGRTTWNPFH